MAFKSEAQRRHMHKNHPEIAKEWESKTTGPLPERSTERVSKFTDANPDLVKALKSIEN